MDEARFGLIPCVRRIWAPRGGRPTASSRRKYPWCYLHSFVHPVSGASVHYVMPTVNADVFEIALREFALDVDAGLHRQVVLVLDGAGWHRAAREAGGTPDNVHQVFLPPYSPESQPAERLWPLINEQIANRSYETIEALEETVGARAVEIMNDPDHVSRLTNYHWWPDDLSTSRTDR